MIRIENQPPRLVVDGAASVEDADGLLRELLAQPGLALDLAACRHVHAASLIVLMALRPALCAAPPADSGAHRLLAAAGLLPRAAAADTPSNDRAPEVPA